MSVFMHRNELDIDEFDQVTNAASQRRATATATATATQNFRNLLRGLFGNDATPQRIMKGHQAMARKLYPDKNAGASFANAEKLMRGLAPIQNIADNKPSPITNSREIAA